MQHCAPPIFAFAFRDWPKRIYINYIQLNSLAYRCSPHLDYYYYSILLLMPPLLPPHAISSAVFAGISLTTQLARINIFKHKIRNKKDKTNFLQVAQFFLPSTHSNLN